MADARLDRLARTRDLRAIAEGVLRICQEYGAVRSCDCIRLKRPGDEQDVVCLVQLDSERQQSALIRDLGARPFGAGVCLKFSQQGPGR
jgi:hypothetical protein